MAAFEETEHPRDRDGRSQGKPVAPVPAARLDHLRGQADVLVVDAPDDEDDGFEDDETCRCCSAPPTTARAGTASVATVPTSLTSTRRASTGSRRVAGERSARPAKGMDID